MLRGRDRELALIDQVVDDAAVPAAGRGLYQISGVEAAGTRCGLLSWLADSARAPWPSISTALPKLGVTTRTELAAFDLGR